MRTVNEARWSETQASLRAEETGARFLDFFTFWFDAAETLLDEGYHGEFGERGPVIAMREALELAEQELGFITIDWIGQMLCVASMHWQHGKRMAEEMTPIEVRAMETALAMKIAQLQESANQ